MPGRQEGAKRGVRIGDMSEPSGSRDRQWSMHACVAAIVASVLSSQ